MENSTKINTEKIESATELHDRILHLRNNKDAFVDSSREVEKTTFWYNNWTQWNNHSK